VRSLELRNVRLASVARKPNDNPTDLYSIFDEFASRTLPTAIFLEWFNLGHTNLALLP